MSIFSSIGNAFKNVANTVAKAVSPVYNVISNTLGSKNVASASSAPVFGSSEFMRQTASQGSGYGIGQKVPMGASGSWTTTLSAGQLSPGINSSSDFSGGGLITYGPKLPVTISSGQQRTSTSMSTDLYGPVYTPTTLSAKSLGAQTTGTGTLMATGGVGITQPVTVNNAPTSTNVGRVDTTKIAGGVSKYGYKYNPVTGAIEQEQVQPQEDTIDTKLKKQMEYIKKYVPEDPILAEDPEVIKATQQRREIQDSLKGPTNELNAIIAKQNQDLLQLRQTGSQEGVTEAVYGGQQNAINYNAAIRAIPLQAKIAIIQGDLKLAQDYLTELRETKKEQINRQVEANRRQMEMIKGIITKEDERTYNEMNKEIERQENSEKDLVDFQVETMGKIYENYGANVPQSVINGINNARNKQEVVTVAGQYLAKQGVSTMTSGEYSSIINGAAGLVASTKKQQVKDNIASALSSGNYETAYAEIANAVSDGITGTNKTKFDDARTDIRIMYGMRNAIQQYADAGGNMNLLVGKAEDIKKKLGIDSGKASALATQLWREFQTYRSNMTGAAFTPQESRDYASVNPTLGKSLDLNLSVIDGALAQLTNRVTSTINARIPDAQKIYDKAYGNNQQQLKTINISGKDYVVGQVYQDASGTKWVVDSNGKWKTQ